MLQGVGGFGLAGFRISSVRSECLLEEFRHSGLGRGINPRQRKAVGCGHERRKTQCQNEPEPSKRVVTARVSQVSTPFCGNHDVQLKSTDFMRSTSLKQRRVIRTLPQTYV